VGLTGSILVFQDEIDAALNKNLFESLEGQKRYGIDEIIPLVQQKYPDRKFEYVFQTDEENPNATYRFYNFTTEEEFFVNPYTAELCGKRLINSSFIRIVTNIHRTLLIPAAGRYIVGLATLCMLILTISGLRLWVPQQYKKWKQWRAVLTVNFKAGFKRQNYDWHNVLGFYSAPVIILLSITGFAITFSTVFIAFLFMLTGQSPQSVAGIFGQKSAYTQDAKKLSATEVAKIASAEIPQAQLLGIAVPTDSSMVYRLDLKSDGASRSGNRIMLMIDQYTGRIVLNSEKDFPNIGNSYLSWLTPIHYGTFGGMPTRILALLGGLMPLLLYVTGFIIWWPRYKKQTAKATYVAPRPDKTEQQLHAIRKGKLSVYFGFYFKKGIRYALLLLVAAFISGALYGLLSGVIIQPALFCVLYTGICIVVNFIIALLVFMANLVFLAPFKRSKRNVFKYFSFSLALTLVFLPVIIAIAQLSRNIF
jgi:uncharacterized iron-regulated membrane protein